MSVRLSKSKLIAFRQCPKRFWLEINRPELRQDDAGAEQRFAAGHQVGDLARAQYPDGILIAPDNDLRRALEETKALISAAPGKTLFEATFQAHHTLVRADLLVPARKGWHMVEVKSSTSVKPYHIEDAAIQTWIAREAGLPVIATSIQVVDSQWTYPGGGKYSGLLKNENVTDAIAPITSEVRVWIDEARHVASKSEPQQAMGKHCSDPFECGFRQYCESLTSQPALPINWLPRLTTKQRERMQAAGQFDLSQVNPEELTDQQRLVHSATLNGKAFRRPLSMETKRQLSGTRYYLDFETIGFTVPIWAGTRPYAQLPFQWSCHIESVDGRISHKEFLDISGDDPGARFAEALIEALGGDGPIIVYNAAFEKRIIRELADRFKRHSKALEAILERIVDLLPITRDHFYHPDQQGSWSIKAVLPAIAPELDYGNLGEVSDGGGAQAAYLEAIHPATTEDRRRELEGGLRRYCARDTDAMRVVLHHLMSVQ